MCNCNSLHIIVYNCIKVMYDCVLWYMGNAIGLDCSCHIACMATGLNCGGEGGGREGGSVGGVSERGSEGVSERVSE